MENPVGEPGVDVGMIGQTTINLFVMGLIFQCVDDAYLLNVSLLMPILNDYIVSLLVLE